MTGWFTGFGAVRVVAANECMDPLAGDAEPSGGFSMTESLLANGADDDEARRLHPQS